MAELSPRETVARTLLDQPVETSPPSPANSTETVCIACKMPNGLQLVLHREEEYDEPMFGGGTKRVKRFLPIPDTEVVLRGPGRSISMMPADQVDQFAPGGYGLTPGVPRSWWENWLSRNRDSHIVRNKIVFASADTPRAAAQAREQREVQSGLQPVDPQNIHKRIPRARGEPIIETAEGMGVLGKK